VEDIDPGTLALGPGGSGPKHRREGGRGDLNRDGLADWLVHFPIRGAGIALGNAEACFWGQTRDGTAFEGCDSIRTVPLCGLGFEVAMILIPLFAVRRKGQGA
jgi:hypothetical protein